MQASSAAQRMVWHLFVRFPFVHTDLVYSYHRRALKDHEKKCYIKAVKCLQSRPAHNTSRPASWTRFDEFQATHIELGTKIHYVVSVLVEPSSYLPTWSIYVRGNFFPGIDISWKRMRMHFEMNADIKAHNRMFFLPSREYEHNPSVSNSYWDWSIDSDPPNL